MRNIYVGPDQSLGDYPKWGEVTVSDVIEKDGKAIVILSTGHEVYPNHIRWEHLKPEWLELLVKHGFIETFPGSGSAMLSISNGKETVVTKDVYTQKDIIDSFFLVLGKSGNYIHCREAKCV